MRNTIKPKKKVNNDPLKTYLNRQKIFLPRISEVPADDLQFCIVIPSYNEPGLLKTLDSVRSSDLPARAAEVIIVVNSSESSENDVLVQNEHTIKEIIDYKEQYDSYRLKFHYIHCYRVSDKIAGAGYARKAGMDEAISRFNISGNPDGIIISLDADTLCKPNYFTEIENFYKKYINATGCNIYFEHYPDNVNDRVLEKNIISYELYLRYYSEALRFIGFPYYYHTIGSCFTVKAAAYCKQGGMGIKQAGEDFYFLQKLFYLGNYYELNTTVVYPSGRISDRAIFGTGPSLGKMDDSGEFRVYSLKSFLLFKNLFEKTGQLYSANYENIICNFPLIFKDYLDYTGFNKNLEGLKKNASNLSVFKKRFFHIFNNLFVIKGLNHLSRNGYEKEPVLKTANELLKELNHVGIYNEPELLNFYRKIQKERGITFLQ